MYIYMYIYIYVYIFIGMCFHIHKQQVLSHYTIMRICIIIHTYFRRRLR